MFSPVVVPVCQSSPQSFLTYSGRAVYRSASGLGSSTTSHRSSSPVITLQPAGAAPSSPRVKAGPTLSSGVTLLQAPGW